jgi:DNA repair protein RadD
MSALKKPKEPQLATGITLRWYQSASVDATFCVLEEDEKVNPLIVLPTGSGKSLVGAEVCRRFLSENPGQRIISAVHSRELVSQNYMAFRRVFPSASAGIFSASLNRKDRHADVTFANIQSIARVAKDFRRVGLMLIDEAHLIRHDDDGQYRQAIRDLRANFPGLRVVGLTATPWRLTSGSLVEAWKDHEPLFTAISYELPLITLVQEGTLAPLVAKSTRIKQDVEGVKKAGGEFVASQLDAKVNTDDLNDSIVRESVATLRQADRHSWLCFAVSVDHAMRLRDLFRAYGVKAEMVSGETPARERDVLLRSFKEGRIECMVNCGVLTTGFDAPRTDALILAKPTSSPGLYLQILGRGMRTFPGKDDCLVLDFGMNVLRFGLADMVEGVRKGRKKDADDLLKVCKHCQAYCAKDDEACHACGQPFPKGGGGGVTAADREAKLNKKNSATKIASERSDCFDLQVLAAVVAPHLSNEGPPKLKVAYDCTGIHGPVRVNEFIDLEHRDELGHMTSWRRRKAEAWWRARSALRPPSTIDEAMRRLPELRRPQRLMARVNDKGWLNVVAAIF